MSTRDLKAFARQGGEVLLEVIPRVALGGILGSLKCMFLMGAFGGIVSLATLWMWSGTEVPGWLRFSLLLTPLVLGFAGIYVGGLRGALEALVKQMSERQVLAYVYAQVKPAALAAARAVPSGGAKALADKTRENLRQLLEEEQEGLEKPRSFAEKLARSVALRAQRLLASSAADYIGDTKSREEAVAKVEGLGIQKLEEIAADTLNDLFSLHVTLVLGLSLLASLVPQAIWWLSR